MIIGPINSGPAVGANGVATSNKDTATPVRGFVIGIHVKYNLSPPATCDVVVKTKGSNAPIFTLLTLTDQNTDKWVWPRVQVQGVNGVDLGGLYDWPLIDDYVNVSIAQADALDNVDVYLEVDQA